MSEGWVEKKQDWQRRISLNLPEILLLVLVTGLIWYAYDKQIINANRETAYGWLTGHWRDISHYSHGPLIPLIAGGLLWWKREELRKLRIQPERVGLTVLAAAMGLYYVGVKGGQERVVVISFVVMLYGLAWALGGRELLWAVFFPVSFLFLMIPLNFLEERVGVPLQHLMAICSSGVLNIMGIATQRVGTGIFSSVFQFDVAAPCSGIRSLMALTTVTAAYAYVTQRSQWKRWLLFLSAMPLAVVGNMARVISIALVAHAYGQEVALRTYHDWSGYIVYAVALVAMVGLGWLLDRPYRQMWEHWLVPVKAKKTL